MNTQGNPDEEKRTEEADWLEKGLATHGEPEWFRKLSASQMRGTMPTVTARTPKDFENLGEFGAWMGNRWALLRTLKKDPEKFAEKFSDDKAKTIITEWEKDICFWWLGALSGTAEQARQFCKRFCDAWERGCVDEEGLPVGAKGDDLTPRIRQALLDHWREVETMTLSEICDFLLKMLPEDKQQYYGQGKQRERFEDRVKHICQRCGLHYRPKAD